MSLRSLGLSKDPKDAQGQPSCFPDTVKSDADLFCLMSPYSYLKSKLSRIKQ